MDYPVYYENRQVGTVQLLPQGSRIQVEVCCRLDGAGLYRAYLLCRQGEYPLGVLEPRGEEVYLRRTVLTGEVERLGAVRYAEARMSYAFSGGRGAWRELGPGERFFQRDRELAALLPPECKGVRWRQEGEVWYLALPYDPRRPFPLPRLFCFARIQSIGGCSCVVYAFDREERPVMVEDANTFHKK